MIVELKWPDIIRECKPEDAKTTQIKANEVLGCPCGARHFVFTLILFGKEFIFAFDNEDDFKKHLIGFRGITREFHETMNSAIANFTPPKGN